MTSETSHYSSIRWVELDLVPTGAPLSQRLEIAWGTPLLESQSIPAIFLSSQFLEFSNYSKPPSQASFLHSIVSRPWHILEQLTKYSTNAFLLIDTEYHSIGMIWRWLLVSLTNVYTNIIKLKDRDGDMCIVKAGTHLRAVTVTVADNIVHVCLVVVPENNETGEVTPGYWRNDQNLSSFLPLPLTQDVLPF
ncbi:hypothetical protein EVAR_96370_1 [Eumeta japonica]|uniref:Uncharacterized protein n=1 Tax=Eumeta variegata TaxID=151549 RepID=A0A4C1T259_EUMVA|nr:hypothetical protein EVAR_96370_1 [Eumeta japonica]